MCVAGWDMECSIETTIANSMCEASVPGLSYIYTIYVQCTIYIGRYCTALKYIYYTLYSMLGQFVSKIWNYLLYHILKLSTPPHSVVIYSTTFWNYLLHHILKFFTLPYSEIIYTTTFHSYLLYHIPQLFSLPHSTAIYSTTFHSYLLYHIL